MMSTITGTLKIGVTAFVCSLFLTSCGSSGGGAIDGLLGGGSNAPILTSVPKQLVQQGNPIHIDINNIRNGSPGNDDGMTYTCVYELSDPSDPQVLSGQPCSTIPSSIVSFSATTGILDWTPNVGILGDFTFKVTGTSSEGTFDTIFTIGVRLHFEGVSSITAITGLGATLNWNPNAQAQGYQVFKLNTSTGQYELVASVAGGTTSNYTITSFAPNTGYTVRVQSVDGLGNLDGNATVRSFTTTLLTKLAMTPATVTVASGTPQLITVQAFNIDDSPQTVGGLDVAPNILGGTSTGTFSAVTDHNNGTYSFTFTPIAVGSALTIGSTMSSTFYLINSTVVTVVPNVPNVAHSNLTISASPVVSGQSVTLTATVKDLNDNTISSGVVVGFTASGGTSTGVISSVTNVGNGVYTATYTGVKAGTAQTINLTINGTPLGNTTSVYVVPGTPVSANSTLSISPTTVVSGSTGTITATLKDINNNPVPSGITVTFAASGGTSTGTIGAVTNAGNGVYTATYTGIMAGSAQTLFVSVDGVTLVPTANVIVVHGAPVTANSSINVSADPVVSGSFVTVTATLADANNNPVTTGTVGFTKTGGTSTGTFNAVTNQGNGVYSVRYTGVAAGTAQTLGVQYNASPLVGLTVPITVIQGSPDAAHSSISAASPTVISGSTDTITATIRDINNNPIDSGITVTFYKVGGTSTGTFSAVTPLGGGQYAINYQGVVAGTAQTIGINVDGSPLGPTTLVTVLPGAPDASLSTLTVSSATVVAGSTSLVTATIVDAQSNPISTGILVAFDKFGGTSFGNFGSVTNQGNGVYTVVYTGQTSGTANTIQANVSGSGFGPTKTIQVLTGAPSAGHSSLTITSSPVQSGSVANISATVRDAYNNPILTEYVISFDAIGGSSTGVLGPVVNAGGGTYTTTYTGAIAGTAQTLRVLADSIPISGFTGSIQVIPGAVDSGNSTFLTDNSTVQAGTDAIWTIKLRDANNNAISGATITFTKSGGTSDGTIGPVTVTGVGNYSAHYTAVTKGTAQTITLVVGGTSTGMTLNETVIAGPPSQMDITGPTNPINSIDCVGPYSVTLKDASNNTTSSLSTVTMSFSSTGGIWNGKLFSDSGCLAPITGLTFGPLVPTQSFYYKSYTPQSLSPLTLTPSDISIANGTTTITNQSVLSWIGSALQFTMSGTGSGAIPDNTQGGFINPVGTAIDGDDLYVADPTGNRILKYNITTNTFIGWIGPVGTLETMTAYDASADCTGLAIGTLPTKWCLGGRSSVSTATVMSGVRNIAYDNTYIYVTTGGTSHRVLRFFKTSGTYDGWLGKISNATGISNPGCNVGGNARWCIGGTPGAGALDGQFNNPQSLAVDSGFLYVVDTSNQRIQKFQADGTPKGWVGLVNVAPENWGGQLASCFVSPGVVPSTDASTPGWCLSGATGTAKVSNRYNLSNGPPATIAPEEGFYNPYAITNDGTYLYVADANNARVVRINMTSGAFSGWIGYNLSKAGGGNNVAAPAPNATTRYTSDWTDKGQSYASTGVSGFGYVRGITTDGTYLYIADDYHRITRVNVSDGQGMKWIGRASASPTGGYTGCSSTPIGGIAPGWCTGGSGGWAGQVENSFFNPYGLAIYTNSLPNKLYIADVNNFRVSSVDLNDGTPTGWIGGDSNAANAKATTWNRTLASGLATAYWGIDDYSQGDIGANWNTVATNSNFMFQTDFTFHRIKKFDKLTGLVKGYIGLIGTFAPTGPAACAGYTSGMTPDWCTGGGRTNYGAGIHGYQNPYSVAADNTYIYIANYNNQRIDRVRISDGLYLGWIGRVATVPTDGDPACLTTLVGNPTPNWCIGGTASAANNNGMLNYPRAVYFDPLGGYLYAVDSTYRLMKINPADGQFAGVTGNVQNATGVGCTPNGNTANLWCTSGTGQGGLTTYGGMNAVTAIAANTNYIFTIDAGTHRLHRYDKSTGAPAGFVAEMTNMTNLNVGPTGGACNGLSGANKPTPGWCYGTAVGVVINTRADTGDGTFSGPRGVWADDNYIYVTDTGNNRVVRIDATSGAFKGWKGVIDTVPVGASNPPSCLAATSGSVTPDWCYGGTAKASNLLGGFDFPTGLGGDSNYLYVLDSHNNRTVTVPRN